MLSKAIGSYIATQVDAAINGKNWQPIYRVRAEVVNRFFSKIRDLTGLIFAGSRVYHNSLTDVRRACELNIREVALTLTNYSTLLISYAPLWYLHFDEASGNFVDSSGNSRTFTTNGTIAYSQPSLLPGYINNAIKPNGTTGYASRADEAAWDVSTITLCGWWAGTGTSRALVDRDDGSSNRFFRLAIDASGYVAFTLTFSGPSTKTFTASIAPVNDGNPHFICATYSGSFVTIEVDGVILSRTAETRAMATGTLAINIGRTLAGTQFNNGTLDEWAMFNRSLTAAERRNLYQSGVSDTAEIDFTRDFIRVYMAIGMVADPDITVDADWAEYALITADPLIPVRQLGEVDIIRPVTGYDMSFLLKAYAFQQRWTVAGGVNYITGTNGILAIAALTGLDTTSWSITSTTLTLPATIEFKIGDNALEAINYLLAAIAYKSIHFTGSGQAVIEPIILPANRTIEDTLSTDATSQIAAEMEYAIDLTQAFNIQTYYTGNPDATFLNTTYTNTNWNSPVSVQKIGPRPAPPIQLDAGDSNSLITGAQNQVAIFAGLPARVKLKTVGRPFADNEDCYQGNFTGTSPTFNISGKYIEEDWNLPLDIGTADNVLMEHTWREAVSV